MASFLDALLGRRTSPVENLPFEGLPYRGDAGGAAFDPLPYRGLDLTPGAVRPGALPGGGDVLPYRGQDLTPGGFRPGAGAGSDVLPYRGQDLTPKPPAAQAPSVARAAATPAGPAQQVDLSNLGPTQREEFYRRAMTIGQDLEQRYGVPAEWLAAVAGSESNYGNTPSNVLTGIKADPSDPRAVWLDTHEIINGQRVDRKEPFLPSGSAYEALERTARLVTSGRYAPAFQAFQQHRNRDQYARDINAAGYATDTNWAQNLVIPGMREAERYRQAVTTSANPPAAAESVVPVPGALAPVARGQAINQPLLLLGGQPGMLLTTHREPMPNHPVPYHRGLDLRAADGTNQSTYGMTVQSPVEGTVVYSQYENYGGHGVMVQMGDGRVMHLYHFQPGAAPVGTRLRVGDPIGKIGWATPQSDSHLHIEVADSTAGQRRDFDPWPYLR